MKKHRADNDQPAAISEWGWRYHHIGIPTTEHLEGESYMSSWKLGKSGFETSPFGIEWMRYDKGSPVHELIQRVPHIAFEVDDIDAELKKHDLKILTPPNSPGSGTRVVMIEHNGAPVELIEFEKKSY